MMTRPPRYGVPPLAPDIVRSSPAAVAEYLLTIWLTFVMANCAMSMGPAMVRCVPPDSGRYPESEFNAALAVMLALAVGSRAGIGGMILAVPVACMVRILWIELIWSKRHLPEDDVALKKKRRKPKPAAPARG